MSDKFKLRIKQKSNRKSASGTKVVFKPHKKIYVAFEPYKEIYLNFSKFTDFRQLKSYSRAF